MQGQYDDLPQESWDSACEHMPQDYLDNVMTQIGKPRTSKYVPLSTEEHNRLYHQWKRATLLECYGRDIGEYKRA